MESKIQSLFSDISKSNAKGHCCCWKDIGNISFNFFIDINIYLDTINVIINFSDVLKSNFRDFSDPSIECKCGKEKVIKSKATFIKLPNILIFTLERNSGNSNKVNKIMSKNK